MTFDFSQFDVGDTAVFTQRFSPDAFDAFSVWSGDANPLHHDVDFAAHSRFGRTIVPLHLTAAPLSRIAGMIFPGEPSLYLGHELEALEPVYYDDTLTYSARIVSINTVLQVLVIRVLVIRDADVVAQATMRVQATAARWKTPPLGLIRKVGDRGTALITGATGEIGSAVAIQLGRQGYRLLLIDRGNQEKRAKIVQSLHDADVTDFDIIGIDLRHDSVEGLKAAIAGIDHLSVVVHAASAPVDASMDDLVTTNFVVLKSLCDATLPKLLTLQHGRILFIGSTAMLTYLPGMADYAAAKAMATNHLSLLDRKFAKFGVRGFSVLPGYVATDFSASLRGDNDALDPVELATQIRAVLAADERDSNVVTTDVAGGSRDGYFGFHTSRNVSATAPVTPSAETPTHPEEIDREEQSIADRLALIIARELQISALGDPSIAGIGITPGWDSLKQISIILAVEAAFGVSFRAGEIEKLHTFEALSSALYRNSAQ